MPADPEGPPRPLPWYLFYASLAVATLTIAAAGIGAWRSGEGRRRDLRVRAVLLTGVVVFAGTLGVLGLAERRRLRHHRAHPTAGAHHIV